MITQKKLISRQNLVYVYESRSVIFTHKCMKEMWRRIYPPDKKDT